MSRTRQRAFDEPDPGQLTTLSWDYPSGWQVPEHAHAAHQLVYASHGAMTVHAARGTWMVPPTWAVWVPGGVVHAIDMLGDVSMRTVYLAPRLAPRLPATCRVLAITPLLRELVLHAVERGRLDRRRPADAALIAVLADQLRALPAVPTFLPEPRDERAARIARWLRAEPADRRTLAALATAAGASPRTVQRAFEHETGMTFARWRQQLRMLHALRRVVAGAKVSAAAAEVGYDSPSAFVAAFRRQLGETPARFATAPRTAARAARSPRRGRARSTPPGPGCSAAPRGRSAPARRARR